MLHISIKYDDCNCYSLSDTDLNIELKQLLTLVNLITEADEDANADTNAQTNTNAYLLLGSRGYSISSPLLCKDMLIKMKNANF